MAYTDLIIQTVWEKTRVVDSNDSKMWRKDECGAWIQRMMYGDQSSQYGWEIVQIIPDGPDDASNLCAMQWRNKIGKGDGRLMCSVTAAGIDNKETQPRGESSGELADERNQVGLDRR